MTDGSGTQRTERNAQDPNAAHGVTGMARDARARQTTPGRATRHKGECDFGIKRCTIELAT